MNTLTRTRGDMDTLVMCLQELMKQGWILKSLYNEINDQLDEQEY